MKEYRIKKGIRILIYVLASLVISLYGGLAILIVSPFNTIAETPEEKLWLPLLFLVMVILMIIAIISISKRKVVVCENSIILFGFLRTRELKFNEIKGFNTATNPKITFLEHIGVEPIDRKKKAIVFNNMIENSSEIKAFLSSKLADLDQKKREEVEKTLEEEKQEILSNQEFGISLEEREGKLEKAKFTSYLLIGAGILVTLWTIFFPRPYEYAVIACIALPIITLIVIKFWKGLIRIDGAKNSVYPNVAYPLVAPGIALSLRVMLDFSIDNYANVWLPVVLIAIIYTGILLSFSKHLSFKKGKDIFSILSYAMFTFIYGFGTVVCTNCVFDKSNPELFSTEIINKEVNRGKYVSYYLYLAPWNHKKEIEKVSIDADLFNSVSNGQEVAIYSFKGKFDIPWFVVDKKN
ncbi:hypothetical protein ABXT06_19365 [Flavobacterium sp. UW10123]|uniref:hypothetical protein n=1 Tax=Flavobacterium sp. UW10123 TaxID=3230800 RepID=UPI00339743D7